MAKPTINRVPSSEDPRERAYRLLEPFVLPTLSLIPGEEFSTRQFVTYLRAYDKGEDAYQFAVSGWKDNLTLGRQTLHGQILPQLLRNAGVEWLGYIYGNPEEEDGLSVPSLWQKPSSRGQE
jgi:hypothetical protein